MSSACRCGRYGPRALMLSADPLPQSPYRAVVALTVRRAWGSIRYRSHHLSVTLDTDLQTLGWLWGASRSRGVVSRLAAHDREDDARKLVGERDRNQLEWLCFKQLVHP